MDIARSDRSGPEKTSGASRRGGIRMQDQQEPDPSRLRPGEDSGKPAQRKTGTRFLRRAPFRGPPSEGRGLHRFDPERQRRKRQLPQAPHAVFGRDGVMDSVLGYYWVVAILVLC